MLAAAVPAASQCEGHLGDVPYAPSPQDVVEAMLALAEVKESDVVYDLGSGDGRIVVTAARKYGARGVGVEVDPGCNHEAYENAKNAGVTGRVRFIEQSFFDADIGEATVVTLYVGEEMNLRLKPRLLKELRPGTRIVSHNYDMGDWKPDKQIEVSQRKIYLWVVPERTG